MKSMTRMLAILTVLLASFSATAATTGNVGVVTVINNGIFIFTLVNAPTFCSNPGTPNSGTWASVQVGVNSTNSEGAKMLLSQLMAAKLAGKQISVTIHPTTPSGVLGCSVSNITIN